MAEQLIEIGGCERQYQQQHKLDMAKDNLITTTASVHDTEDNITGLGGWKEGDGEVTDPRDPRPTYTLRTMDMAPPDLVGFVKLKEFEKFYTYIGERHTEVKVKHCFFDKGKLWDRRWDFFYIYPPADIQERAILLLPLEQAEHFLRTINRHLGTNIAIPWRVEAPGLIMYAPDNGTDRPRYIAKCEEAAAVPGTKLAIPRRGWSESRPPPPPPNHVPPTDEASAEFRDQMESLALTNLQKKARDRGKREIARHAQQKAKGREIMRTQRYLGFRKRNNTLANNISGGQNGPTNSEDSDAELDLQDVTPHPQEGSVVFICIDIEAYEFPPTPITEVGVAILDTADIAGIAPGMSGRSWFSKIRAQHFLVEEHRYRENKVHCQGNRDGFLFGRTEVVPYKDLKKRILECFKPPFSPSSAADLIDISNGDAKRNIVFVGHDAKQDVDYLKKLNIDLSEIKDIKDVIDSSNMYQALRRADNKTGLGNVLLNCDLIGTNLHNGGNDAVYTLQAMIATAIKAEVEKDTLVGQHGAELEKRIEEGVDHQKFVLAKQKEGWDLGEESDGGDVEDAWAAFKPKQPKPKIVDVAKGAWTPELARNLPGAAPLNTGPAGAHRPAQPRGNIMAVNTWRPGIQDLEVEDIK